MSVWTTNFFPCKQVKDQFSTANEKFKGQQAISHAVFHSFSSYPLKFIKKNKRSETNQSTWTGVVSNSTTIHAMKKEKKRKQSTDSAKTWSRMSPKSQSIAINKYFKSIIYSVQRNSSIFLFFVFCRIVNSFSVHFTLSLLCILCKSQ